MMLGRVKTHNVAIETEYENKLFRFQIRFEHNFLFDPLCLLGKKKNQVFTPSSVGQSGGRRLTQDECQAYLSSQSALGEQTCNRFFPPRCI